jgi:hypothetical protein
LAELAVLLAELAMLLAELATVLAELAVTFAELATLLAELASELACELLLSLAVLEAIDPATFPFETAICAAELACKASLIA